MRSEASLDQQIRMLESRIRDRRLALHESAAELKHSAVGVKARLRSRATSPLVWVAALAVGFVAVRLAAHRHREPARSRFRGGRETPKARPMVATLLSALLPFGLRIAQQSLVPWIARTVHNMSSRRRAYDGYYGS